MSLFGREWFDLTEAVCGIIMRAGVAQKQAEDEAVSLVDRWAERIIRCNLGETGAEIKIRALLYVAEREGAGPLMFSCRETISVESYSLASAVCTAVANRVRFWSKQSTRFHPSSRLKAAIQRERSRLCAYSERRLNARHCRTRTTASTRPAAAGRSSA